MGAAVITGWRTVQAIHPNFAASHISPNNDFVRHFDAKRTN